jgi:predicted Zn-dependent peptidase
MKINMIKYALIGFALAGFTGAIAQNKTQAETQKSANGKYSYTTVPNDPLGVRIYTLSNGLTVKTSINKNEPRVYTMIATKAGSKHDPADNTGLAHYLEHMLFKGTDRFGTKDWAKEKEQLDKIDALYERYNKTKDEDERKRIYRQIDSVSLIASRFAIANEYDKMLSNIGATGTNAFTSVEQTVYINDIPSNQLETWLRIEAERFRFPVLRLFHTELEAVYEEKNISLDNDSRKVYEAMLGGLFQQHAYGTQTTIGTVEHLKNPSLIKIREYFQNYYVPNNMAIILAGDFDPDVVVEQIDKAFGYMKPKTVKPYTFGPEKSRTEPTVKEVVGPDAASVMIGFRTPGANTEDAQMIELIDYILSNGKAGLIDQNITKRQRTLSAYSSIWQNKDYGIHFLGGKPKEGQTLEEVKSLLIEQIENLKSGKFDEKLLPAIVSNFKVEQIRNSESNQGRAYKMMSVFCVEGNWADEVNSANRLSSITKQDIMRVAQKIYTNDYVIVYKRVGEDNIQKIEKPEITPVEVNREDVSEFTRSILNTQANPIRPVFLNFDTDIQKGKLASGIEVNYVRNKDNGLFSMYYVLNMGKFNDLKLPIAIEYLKYAGTNKYTAEQISSEFYKLACEFGVSSGEEQTYVYLSGLDENFDKAVSLFEHLLANVKPDQKVVDNMVSAMMKQRADAKLNKSAIFWGALRNYMTFGSDNPYKYMLSESQLKALKANELCGIIKGITSYKHAVYYYGPREINTLSNFLSKAHRTPKILKDYPAAKTFTRAKIEGGKVYFVDYKMVQAEMLWLNKQESMYDLNRAPEIALFNEYFGGGMSSVVFQTIRESKALAYSTFSRYTAPNKPDAPYYITAYVGTQSDKVMDAWTAMNELLRELPVSENNFNTVITSLRNQIETERTTKEQILFAYIGAQRFNRTVEEREVIYKKLSQMNLNSLTKFHNTYYSDALYNMAVMGSKERISDNILNQLGEVIELNLTEIFGY